MVVNDLTTPITDVIIKVGSRIISKDRPCFIIAEAGVNHDGDINKAKKLIDVAVNSGADAVKFQTWITEELMLSESPMADYAVDKVVEKDQYSMIKALELSYGIFVELKKYCEQNGIIFLSTPDEIKSAKFLNDLGVYAFKIGSGELNNIQYLKQVAEFQKPMFVSTGMSTLNEVKMAKNAINSTGNKQTIFLHCTSNYPCKKENVNLLAMQTISHELNNLVGYSDHTLGIEASLLAIHLGAVVIEKHITYDRNAKGPDHEASLSPEDFKKMVDLIRKYEDSNKNERIKIINNIKDKSLIYGSKIKQPVPSEMPIINVSRKSVVSKVNIKRGEIITEDMLTTKRPGTGIPADKLYEFIGKNAKDDINKDTLLRYDLFN